MSKINENSDFLDGWREEQSKYAGGNEQDTTAEAIRSYIESEKGNKNNQPEQSKDEKTKELKIDLQRLISAQEYLYNSKKQFYEKIRAIDEQLNVMENKKIVIESQLTGKPVEEIIASRRLCAELLDDQLDK